MVNLMEPISENFEYKIKTGDSLSKILVSMYGIPPTDSRYTKVKNYVLTINPQITNPDLIKAGEILQLKKYPPTGQSATSVKSAKNINSEPPLLISRNVEPQDRDLFWALSWMTNHTNYLTIPGGIAFGAKGNLLTPGNKSLITDISNLYAQYKSGEITKNQYSYQRKLKLDQLKANFGPAEKWLFGNKTTHQSIRIARGGGIPATAHIAKHSENLNKLSKIAKGGGVVLTGVGVAASCMQIANTSNQDEKNDIFVETVASTTVGIGAGAIIGIFLVSNPIGWGTALVLAAGSAALAYGAGKVTQYGYAANGRKIDFVTGLGVDKVCQ